MKQLLRITSSIQGTNSVSTQLAGELIDALRAEGHDFEVVDRDFGREPIPHLDGAWLQALTTDADARTAEQQAKVAFSDRLIAELKAADIVVIGLPMYNFTVPSMLKAWVDHVARAGVTFRYTEKGPEGLLSGKKVYFVVATGGEHEHQPTDFLRPYLTLIMNFLGITDIDIVSADALGLSPQHKERSLATARAAIARRVAALGAGKAVAA